MSKLGVAPSQKLAQLLAALETKAKGLDTQLANSNAPNIFKEFVKRRSTPQNTAPLKEWRDPNVQKPAKEPTSQCKPVAKPSAIRPTDLQQPICKQVVPKQSSVVKEPTVYGYKLYLNFISTNIDWLLNRMNLNEDVVDVAEPVLFNDKLILVGTFSRFVN